MATGPVLRRVLFTSRRRRRLVELLAWGGVQLLAAALLVVGLWVGRGSALALGFLGGAPLLIAWFVASQRRVQWFKAITLLTDRGLALGEEHFVSWDEICFSGRYGQAARIHTYDGRRFDVSASSLEEANQLVDEVRQRHPRRAYTLEASEPEADGGYQFLAAFGALAVVLCGLLSGPVLLLSVLSLAVPFILGLSGWWIRSRTEVRFGADGIRLVGRLGERYIPYREIAGVTPAGSRVTLSLNTGSTMHIPGARRAAHAWWLATLISEGIEMSKVGEREGFDLSGLERTDETFDEWRARVATAMRGHYRGSAFSPERLGRFLRNPTASTAQRAAAAVALAEHPGGAPAIRIAAEVSAEPDLQEALAELGDGHLDEARLERLIGRG